MQPQFEYEVNILLILRLQDIDQELIHHIATVIKNSFHMILLHATIQQKSSDLLLANWMNH